MSDQPTAIDGAMSRMDRLRAWSKGHPYRTAAIGGGLLAFTVATFVAWLMLAHYATAPPSVTIETALAALDQGKDDQAAVMVEELRQSQALTDAEMGGPLYVLGVLKTRDAERQGSEERREADYLVASKFLERARALGWPAGRTGDGLLKLGHSLIMAGEFDTGAEALEEALALQPEHPGQLHLLLAEALLSAPAPNYAGAMEHLDKALADPTLESTDRSDAQLRRVRTLTRMGQRAAARAALAQLPADPQSARLALVQGELELVEAASDADVSAAMTSFSRAITLDKDSSAVTRTAQFRVGEGLQRLKQNPQAIAQFKTVRRSYPGTLEAVAAALTAGELLLADKQTSEAMDEFRYGLEAYADRVGMAEGVITLTELRKRLLALHAQLLTAERFAEATNLVEQFAGVFPEYSQTRLRAESLELWGDHVLSKVTDPVAEAEQQSFGRNRLREAGLAYETLAHQLYASPRYGEQLWRSAGAYFRGQSFSSVVRILNKYLAAEPTRRNAAALAMVGEAYLALGDAKKSIAALEECIEFYPEDAASYRARLTCAKAYRELMQYDKSEAILRENLNGRALAPNSREWRDSLFELGRLQCETERYEEAIPTLEEMLERLLDFPDRFQSRLARYLLAESYRHAADEPLKRSKEAQNQNELKLNEALAKELLEQALENYGKLQVELTLEVEGDELDRAMLRNCYMLQGDVLFELGRYSEAIEAYSNVSTSWQNEPFVLETLVQISNCWWRLEDPVKARGAIEQAKLVLARLPADANFDEATNFNRTEWGNLLAQMSEWYPSNQVTAQN